MTVYNDQIEEYLWYATYLQGNVNVAGLVFDDLLYEYMTLEDVVYTVNVDLVESGFGLEESFSPDHLMFIDETIDFTEVFGFPSRVRQVAINVLHEPIVSPVELCHMQVDIVQGVDVFWDAVSDGLHFPTESDEFTTIGLLYYGNCFESLGICFEVAEGTPGVWKAVYPYAEDIINSMHEIEALWYFNNLSDEQLFTYDSPLFGWQHNVLDGFVITDNVRRYLGFKIIEYLFLKEGNISGWKGFETLIESLFAWDLSNGAHGWEEEALESINLNDDSIAPFMEKLLEELSLTGDQGQTVGKATLTAIEAFKFLDTVKAISTVVSMVSESLDLSDYFESTSVTRGYNESIQESFVVGAGSTGNMTPTHLVEDSFAYSDSSPVVCFMDIVMDESLNIEGEIN